MLATTLGFAAAAYFVLPILRYTGSGGEANLAGVEFYFLVSLIGAVTLEAQRRAQRRAARHAAIAQERLRQLRYESDLRRESERRLLEAEKLESIGFLASGIAHDFNNLLTSILGNTSLAIEDLSENSSARRQLEEPLRAAERTAHLTSQLLAYAGKGQFSVGLFDLSQVTFQTIERLRPSIPTNVQVRLELQQGLPKLHTDPSHIQQVITNLVLNGVEAIGEGRTGIVTVETTLKRFHENDLPSMPAVGEITPGTYLLLRISDIGAGMDNEIVTRIFDPFFTTKFTGRGLGLAAVSGIIRSLGGAVMVHTAPEHGTTFSVCFPSTGDSVFLQPATPS